MIITEVNTDKKSLPTQPQTKNLYFIAHKYKSTLLSSQSMEAVQTQPEVFLLFSVLFLSFCTIMQHVNNLDKIICIVTLCIFETFDRSTLKKQNNYYCHKDSDILQEIEGINRTYSYIKVSVSLLKEDQSELFDNYVKDMSLLLFNDKEIIVNYEKTLTTYDITRWPGKVSAYLWLWVHLFFTENYCKKQYTRTMAFFTALPSTFILCPTCSLDFEKTWSTNNL